MSEIWLWIATPVVVLLVVRLSLFACGSSAPTVTLRKVHCEGTIAITATASTLESPGHSFKDTVVVTVTCDGSPVEAEVLITWPNGSMTTSTTKASTGQTTVTTPPFMTDQHNTDVTVTVEGSDGRTTTTTAHIP